MHTFQIYLCGVGGQGVGLLCEILLRAADYAGHVAKAVDTHGLAQRGGAVVSHIRLGEAVHSPLIADGTADLVVALERHEALRALQKAARNGGVLVYYDTVMQPLGVRLGVDPEISGEDIALACSRRNMQVYAVTAPELPDPRMQNMVVLAGIIRQQLLPGVTSEHCLAAMDDLMQGQALAANRELFIQRVAG